MNRAGGLILLLIFALPLFAGGNASRFVLKAGPNWSSFYTTPSNTKQTYAVALGYEVFFTRHLSLVFELGRGEHQTVLKNKRFWSEFVYTKGDLIVDVKYYEIPITVRYMVGSFLQVFGGFSTVYTYNDRSFLKNEQYIDLGSLSEEEKNQLPIDYYWIMDAPKNAVRENSTIDVTAGVSIFIKRFFMEFRYSRNFIGKYQNIIDASLDENMHYLDVKFGLFF